MSGVTIVFLNSLSIFAGSFKLAWLKIAELLKTISKIKTKFENAIGSELAKNYYIKGENSEVRKIDIDRKLVEVAD